MIVSNHGQANVNKIVALLIGPRCASSPSFSSVARSRTRPSSAISRDRAVWIRPRSCWARSAPSPWPVSSSSASAPMPDWRLMVSVFPKVCTRVAGGLQMLLHAGVTVHLTGARHFAHRGRCAWLTTVEPVLSVPGR